MSTLKTNTIQHLTSGFNNIVTHTDGAGTVNAAHCRAWVNFDGTGTVAIRAQFNVNSITDNGTGDYTINFTNAFSDSNYCYTHNTFGGAGGSLTDYGLYTVSPYTSAPSSTALRVAYRQSSGSGTLFDTAHLCCSVFR